MLKYVINSTFSPDFVFLPTQTCHESMKIKSLNKVDQTFLIPGGSRKDHVKYGQSIFPSIYLSKCLSVCPSGHFLGMGLLVFLLNFGMVSETHMRMTQNGLKIGVFFEIIEKCCHYFF